MRFLYVSDLLLFCFFFFGLIGCTMRTLCSLDVDLALTERTDLCCGSCCLFLFFVLFKLLSCFLGCLCSTVDSFEHNEENNRKNKEVDDRSDESAVVE